MIKYKNMHLENNIALLPLMVQSDRSILLDVHAPLATKARDALIPFAQLETSPEHLHTYRLTPLTLWNAASSGFTPEEAIAVLHKFSRYEVPQNVEIWIKEMAGRFGKLRLINAPCQIIQNEDATTTKIEYLYLVSSSKKLYNEISSNAAAMKFLTITTYISPKDNVEIEITPEEKQFCFLLELTNRGILKQTLLEAGWPVKDDVPLIDGEPLDFNLRDITLQGKKLVLRDYQKEAAESVVANKGPGTGFGTVVLPCGAGKTIVGMAIMNLLKTSTLIITTNITAVHQWIGELLDKSNLTQDEISEYTGENKEIKPVTVATYQILTWRVDKQSSYPHFALFKKRHWGLIIYDEVHTLPAPVFRVAAEIQAIRRVGLTATLVREDGHEGHVFSLVGPKRYDVPWRQMEQAGWIAKAQCIEVRLDLPEELLIDYATANKRGKYRIASENPKKIDTTCKLIAENKDTPLLVIGQYITQLQQISKALSCPIITGSTTSSMRDKIYADFRLGKIKVLVVSKVANFAIDLPDAAVAIQVSGSFGSRQEEAQRLGRIMRPKERTAKFYTLITRGTVEEDFASNRQKFLAEQGYEYKIIIPKGNEIYTSAPVGVEIKD